jgi:hypothetical protein
MTLQEAILSGRRFRIKGTKTWLNDAQWFLHHEVLADWEVESGVFLVTEEKLREALLSVTRTEIRCDNKFLGTVRDVQIKFDEDTIQHILSALREEPAV